MDSNSSSLMKMVTLGIAVHIVVSTNRHPRGV